MEKWLVLSPYSKEVTVRSLLLIHIFSLYDVWIFSCMKLKNRALYQLLS